MCLFEHSAYVYAIPYISIGMVWYENYLQLLHELSSVANPHTYDIQAFKYYLCKAALQLFDCIHF